MSDRPRTLLHVAPSDFAAARVRDLLAPSGSFLARARTLAEAQLIAGRQHVTCALLTVEAADDAGLDALVRLRSAFSHLPIVVIDASDRPGVATKAILLGAQECVSPREMTTAGLEHAVDLALARRDAESELLWRASHDELTGLPNRSLVLEHLTRALARSSRATRSVAVLFCDLDRFKEVNDRHGHAAGDEALRAVARRLVASLRPGDVIGRWGGDEFLVVAENVDGEQGGQAIRDRLQRSLASSRGTDGLPFALGLSIGLAVSGSSATATPHELVAAADRAMLDEKARGGGPGARSSQACRR